MSRLTNKDLANLNKQMKSSFFGMDILRTDLTANELQELTEVLDKIS